MIRRFVCNPQDVESGHYCGEPLKGMDREQLLGVIAGLYANLQDAYVATHILTELELIP